MNDFKEQFEGSETGDEGGREAGDIDGQIMGRYGGDMTRLQENGADNGRDGEKKGESCRSGGINVSEDSECDGCPRSGNARHDCNALCDADDNAVRNRHVLFFLDSFLGLAGQVEKNPRDEQHACRRLDGLEEFLHPALERKSDGAGTEGCQDDEKSRSYSAAFQGIAGATPPPLNLGKGYHDICDVFPEKENDCEEGAQVQRNIKEDPWLMEFRDKALGKDQMGRRAYG